jgi:hypothetical protein
VTLNGMRTQQHAGCLVTSEIKLGFIFCYHQQMIGKYYSPKIKVTVLWTDNHI